MQRIQRIVLYEDRITGRRFLTAQDAQAWVKVADEEIERAVREKSQKSEASRKPQKSGKRRAERAGISMRIWSAVKDGAKDATTIRKKLKMSAREPPIYANISQMRKRGYLKGANGALRAGKRPTGRKESQPRERVAPVA